MPAFVIAGVGMSLYFAPVANLVLSAVRRNEEGKASGVNNTAREVGGVFGVAVLVIGVLSRRRLLHASSPSSTVWSPP